MILDSSASKLYPKIGRSDESKLFKSPSRKHDPTKVERRSWISKQRLRKEGKFDSWIVIITALFCKNEIFGDMNGFEEMQRQIYCNTFLFGVLWQITYDLSYPPYINQSNLQIFCLFLLSLKKRQATRSFAWGMRRGHAMSPSKIVALSTTCALLTEVLHRRLGLAPPLCSGRPSHSTLDWSRLFSTRSASASSMTVVPRPQSTLSLDASTANKQIPTALHDFPQSGAIGSLSQTRSS